MIFDGPPGSKQFVAVGGNGTLLTSPDGATWTARNPGTSEILVGIAFGEGRYVAVGNNGTIVTSEDGITWTSHTSGTTAFLRGVGYGNGQFMAVGGIGVILTSPDGVTWTVQAASPSSRACRGTSIPYRGVAYNGSVFVAVGDGGGIVTSPDGTSVCPDFSGTTQNLFRIVHNGDLLYVTGAGGTILTSPDAVRCRSPRGCWSSLDSGTTSGLMGVGFGGDFMLVSGVDGLLRSSSHHILQRGDGVITLTWTTHNTGTTELLTGIAFGNSTFVVVGDGGTILTSSIFSSAVSSVPNAPTGLSAVGGPSSVRLIWNPSSQYFVKGYNVYRSAPGLTGFQKINAELVTRTTAVDSGVVSRSLTPSTYYYQVTAVNLEDRESPPSDVVSATVGGGTLFIPNLFGPAGGTVDVPVATLNGLGISRVRMDIDFDSSLLTATDAKVTNLTSGWTLTKTLQAGRIQLLLQAPSGVSLGLQGGALAYITFSISPGAGSGAVSSLTFSLLELSSGASSISATGTNGSLTVSTAFFPGDPDGNGEANMDDAEKLLRLALNLDTATNSETAAGDLNGDGFVDWKDLILLLRRIAGLSRDEGVSPIRVSPKTVSIGDFTGSPGGQFTASVRVDNGQGISGGSVTIGYDSSILSVQSAVRGDLTTGFSVFGTNPGSLPDSSGQLRIDFANATGITGTGAGSLADVTFQVASGASDEQSSTLTLQLVTLSDETATDITVSASNGSVSIPASIPAISMAGLVILLLLLSWTIFRRVKHRRN